MPTTDAIHISITDNIMPNLLQFCGERQLQRFTLIADDNTYPILGQEVEVVLGQQGWDVNPIILAGPEVVADESYIMQVLVAADMAQTRTYVAVGSGTITDVTRFTSHRTRNSFLSIPTAPSVDGFTSIGAPLVVGGLKQTVICQAPLAVFAHVPTLCAAPAAMIAAGFGDIIGKYTSLADWSLGRMLWAESYSEAVAQRMRHALQNCAEQVDAIATASPEGIRILMQALLESGLCILEAGNSNCASGMEHHISHHLEMKLLWDKQPAVLHGAKVGVAAIVVAGFYDTIRQMSQEQAEVHLRSTPIPNREDELERINTVYGPIADQLIASQASFLDLTGAEYRELQANIVAQWLQIQAIAATVPTPRALASLLQKVGAATDVEALGLSQAELDSAIGNAHYLRNRFTVAKLGRMLGLF